MRFFLFFFFLSSLTSLLAQQKNEPQKPLIKANWLKNPSAEEDEWELKRWETNYPSVNSSNRVSRYGKTASEWDFDCNEKCGLPNGAGNVYFRLESTSDEGENMLDFFQTVDVSELAPFQEKGIEAVLNGWLAGSDSQASTCSELTVYLSLLDSQKKLINQDTIIKNIKDFHTLDEVEESRGHMHKFDPFKMNKQLPANTKFVRVLFFAENKCAGIDASSSSAFYIDLLSLAFYPKKEEGK